MGIFYPMSFVFCMALTMVLIFVSRKGGSEEINSRMFKRFQRSYLTVYYLAMASDWLQGPYVYALYSSYGFAQQDIAKLFVAGFGSSMLFGTFIGGLADRFGRKKFAVLFCVTYMLSCMTKHFKNYNVLMVGRILGGIATSLLFSVPESWLVYEHNCRAFEPQWLTNTFSKSCFGNAVTAIAMGVIAQYAADAKPLTQYSGDFYYGGYCTPFDLSLMCLGVCWLAILSTWNENYGRSANAGNQSIAQSFKDALTMVLRDKCILYCGLVQSLFEGSMYTFVFMWTPTLTPKGGALPPYGLIFSTFMVCSMLGSQLFAIAIGTIEAEEILKVVCALSAIGLAFPVLFSGTNMAFVGFLIFEVCVGVYYPAMGTMKSKFVPESSRSAIYNVFRVPLNAIVLTVLLSHIGQTTAYCACVIFLLMAFFMQTKLCVASKVYDRNGYNARDMADMHDLLPSIDSRELSE